MKQTFTDWDKIDDDIWINPPNKGLINIEELIPYTKATIIMTVFSYGTTIFFFDIMSYPAYIMFWINLPVFFVIRYWVYKKFGKAKFGE